MDFRISDFKMIEAPYELPDPRALTELVLNGIREEEKMYGPVFTTRFINHALQFVAQKIDDEAPSDIKNLDQLLEFLVSKSDKYPTPYCALTYAQTKTENEFQGQTGAGTHLETRSISREVAEKKDGAAERHIDFDDILLKFGQTLTAMRVGPSKWGYKKNVDGSVNLLYPICPFLDGCRLAFDEGLLKRPGGKLRCGVSNFICGYLKISTGYEWDYDLLEFGKPHCIVKYFMF